MTPKVMIILGSGSDIAIAEKSMKILEKSVFVVQIDLYYKTADKNEYYFYFSRLSVGVYISIHRVYIDTIYNFS